ncbi:hypothetical protein [Haloarcula laminariae]|uniref:hypothetical protein n=1 Tax=Haloarcula laminariae TaxID=2961577 RepID=UPI0021C9CA7F|nr:hypothetical protein [Halomicroarcula laminariae]
MNRRTLIAGFGSLASGSVFAIGTGAFTSVSAGRSVSVSVAADDEAFLKLEERGEGRRSYEDGNTVGFDIPGPDDDDYGGTDPEGLGTDSVYQFGDDAAHDESGLFSITNQGTQPVEVYSTQETTSGLPEVTIYDVDTGDLLTEDSPSEAIEVGEQLNCGLEIDTQDVPVREDEYDISLVINAIVTGS